MCRQKYAHQMHITRLKVNSRYAGSEAIEGEARSLMVILSQARFSSRVSRLSQIPDGCSSVASRWSANRKEYLFGTQKSNRRSFLASLVRMTAPWRSAHQFWLQDCWRVNRKIRKVHNCRSGCFSHGLSTAGSAVFQSAAPRNENARRCRERWRLQCRRRARSVWRG